MENPSLFPAAPRHKRKCDSDAVLELLNGVSLSPRSKKMRQEFGSTSYANDLVPTFAAVHAPEVEFSDQPSNEMLLTPPDVDLSEQLLEPVPIAPVNDERALVLYKPVNPPLFPEGPSAGSQVFVNARLLPGVLEASNMLRGSKEDDLYWLQAPKSGVRIVDLSEEEANQPDVFLDNNLAVVPWDGSSTVNMLASQRARQPLNADIGGMSVEDATIGVEAMEEDNELDMNFVNSQPSYSSSSFCYQPWQQYGAPLQPQYSSVMWSH